MLERITPIINFQSELSGLFDFTGDVAYLPGGYGGIGEAIAWGMAINGATVVIGGRNGDKSQSLATQIKDAGFKASARTIDVTSVGEINASVDSIVDEFGKLDILMNCVGIQIEQPLLEVTEEAFDNVYEVNLKASMFLAQAAARIRLKMAVVDRYISCLSALSLACVVVATRPIALPKVAW